MPTPFLPQNGNAYRNLACYKKAACLTDITYLFTQRFLAKGDRTIDQMNQAARSGQSNIAEGIAAGVTSKETELKLLNVAKASHQELLMDYENYLRMRNLPQWDPAGPDTAKARRSCRQHEDPEYYHTIFPQGSDQQWANVAIVMLHQCDYLLHRLIESKKQQFLTQGGIREALTRARLQHREGQ